ncbi:ABC transporter substrate-binding protein [Paramicrobacterium chengjingii]|uniref:ABC transporter substrate-binding protein n=1 Tax=Paramicrobacterium chengjingii TaxID=2769067 RepID=A0ABX6YIB1_9MICO|nr:ABC transporter substrate-binding protein [Microbacterium chengjingii]QPZ38496.1 ABC transporter substrate-binding protein [Microbacterium chengjingii]
MLSAHSRTILRHRRKAALPMLVAASFMLVACSPSSTPSASESADLGISDEDYSLDSLIDAAKEEGPITVYDVTGKIVDTAKNFSEKYGIKATGVKAKANEQQEILIREAQGGNVKSDVFFMTDAPTVSAQILPEGMATSWFPPDLADVVPEEFQNPVSVSTEVDAWSYNTEEYGDTCPIDNVWALTTDDWHGKVALSDPLLRSDFLYWVNQMQAHADDQLASAYEEFFGKALDTSDESAAEQWLKALAANQPIIKKSGGDVAETIGASGQSDPPVGMVSTAEYRTNVDSGFHLGLCEGISPWLGRSYTKVAVIANGTASPNAAKLFVHYLLTQEGIEPQLVDGKFSTNSTVAPSPDEPSGVADFQDAVFAPDPSTAADDFDSLPEWQDLWTINSH